MHLAVLEGREPRLSRKLRQVVGKDHIVCIDTGDPLREKVVDSSKFKQEVEVERLGEWNLEMEARQKVIEEVMNEYFRKNES